jgi:3-keto-disaccharide hydrolase
MEWWSDGVMEFPNTPLLHHPTSPFPESRTSRSKSRSKGNKHQERIYSMRTTLFIAGLAAAILVSHGLAAPEVLNKPPEGFTSLFNGKDLTSWQGLIDIKKRATLSPEVLKTEQAKADERMRAHWSVKDGILVFDGKGDSLQTAKDYGNFELYVDWRIQKAGDSGIYLRGNPQVQIWDNEVGSGGLFNNQVNPSKPLTRADKPVGEWNTFYIKMVGDRATIKLNDQLVVDNVPLENYWERGKPLPARGPIELQNHGNILEFRNIYLRELPDNAQ